jgi:hypothetical protein
MLRSEKLAAPNTAISHLTHPTGEDAIQTLEARHRHLISRRPGETPPHQASAVPATWCTHLLHPSGGAEAAGGRGDGDRLDATLASAASFCDAARPRPRAPGLGGEPGRPQTRLDPARARALSRAGSLNQRTIGCRHVGVLLRPSAYKMRRPATHRFAGEAGAAFGIGHGCIPRSRSEIGALEILIVAQVGSPALQHECAIVENAGAVGHLETLDDVLLDQQQGCSLRVDGLDQ